jgi:hypothetical protein
VTNSSKWILAHEETVVDARSVDLDDVFGASWQQETRNLLCYFVKHMCCRLAEIKTPDVPATIPPDVIAFLDGGPNPASLVCEFSIEPALLHWRDMRPDDPLWTPRPLWLDQLFLTRSAQELQFIQSRWRYSWLSLAWAVGPGANGSHLFAHQSVPIPIVAGSWSPLFELVLADGRYRDATGSVGAEDRIDPAVLESRATRMHSLWDSPVVLAFVASALDFEAVLRGRAPDARRNTTVDADVQISLARELRRTEVLINVCSQWARGRLDQRSLRAAARRLPSSSSIEELAALSTRIQGEKDASTAVASLRADFASLATLQLARAYELGSDTPVVKSHCWRPRA